MTKEKYIKKFLDLEEELDKDNLNGRLYIRVKHAKGLYKISKEKLSNPYCKITLPSVSDMVTSKLKNTCNPIWDYSHDVKIQLNRANAKNILFTIKNDQFLSDSTLGFTSLDWLPCTEKLTRGKWFINDEFDLEQDPKKAEKKKKKYNVLDFGKIYVALKFVKDG